MKVEVSNNPKSNGGKCLEDALRRYNNSKILLLLPGGSSLDVLKYVDLKTLSDNCTIAFGDELYSATDGVYNYDVFSTLDFCRTAKNSGCRIVNPKLLLGRGVEEAGRQHDKFLKSWLVENKNGKIILLAGFGQDGHTYAIYPSLADNDLDFNKRFNNNEVLAVGHNLGKKGYAERFTITLPMIRRADVAIVQGCGQDKFETVKRISENKGNLSITPARIYRELKNSTIFTDQIV